MTTRDPEERLRQELRDELPAPPGLAAMVRRAIRRHRRTADFANVLDVAASPTGVCRIGVGRGEIEAPTARARSLAERARVELAEYLAGARTYFTVPLDLRAVAPFQRTVLESARTIPFGAVRPYGWVAAHIGHPAAARAVGNALGANPLPLVIPCHRVVRSDGTIGDYGLGAAWKARLLELERDTPALVGATSTRIVCRRGCPHERRIAENARIVFASLRDARAVGYRPCRRCRPRD